jgi:hypothetical protein
VRNLLAGLIPIKCDRHALPRMLGPHGFQLT